MICNNCRKEMNRDSDFCSYCRMCISKKIDELELIQGTLSNLFSHVVNKIKEDISNEFLKVSKNEKELVLFDPFWFEVEDIYISNIWVGARGNIVDGTVEVGDELFFLATNFY